MSVQVSLGCGHNCPIIMIIMYIYPAFINAPSAHMIHINLNMIFYTHVEHSPTKTDNLHKVLYAKTNTSTTHSHTHTHSLCVCLSVCVHVDIYCVVTGMVYLGL